MSGEQERPTGAQIRRRVLGDAYVDRGAANPDPFMAEFYQLSTEHAWGGVWVRPGLESKYRSLVTVSALAALGRLHELRIHLNGALNNGWTEAELREACLHLAAYGGFPVAADALRVLRDVLNERGA